jgi:putative ABC transport system permease protein
MNLFNLAIKNLKYRKLSSLLSILLLSFGCALISLVLLAQQQLEKQFINDIKGVDLVVGAKGSPLQLILSAVYQIDAPTGNIALSEFEKLKKNALVKKAIPLSYGDSYSDFRIVGTNSHYLELYGVEDYAELAFPGLNEVLIGAKVAAETGLNVNDAFVGNHGVQNAMEQHDHFSYRVKGILPAQGNVLDKLIICNLSSVWAVHEPHNHEHHNSTHDEEHEDHAHEHYDEDETHDHEHEHTHAEHNDDREITAALIQFKGAMARIMLPGFINDKTDMMAALPAYEINRLFGLVADAVVFLQALALIVILLSGISVFIALYQSLQARKGELALLRNMGAGRWQLFGLICIEGLLIALFSLILAFGLSRLVLFAVANSAAIDFSLTPDWYLFLANEYYLIGASLLISFLASLIPAIQAFYLNIPKTLSNA